MQAIGSLTYGPGDNTCTNMTEITAPAPEIAAEAPVAAAPERKARKEDSFVLFVIKLLVIVLAFRILLFAPFSIPSESMMPRLLVGDQLLASKWSYGISNNSLLFGWRPFPEGRLFASQPDRGDVAIFQHPVDRAEYVKRVIGLPGDQIQMISGVLHINGKPVKKEKIADYVIPVSPNTDCYSASFESKAADGSPVCRYPQYRETLPEGVSYNVLDFGIRQQDFTPAVIVPEGHLFMMGDNRDNSMDSRFPAVPGQGVGIVPQDNLVGKAQVMMWSTDGGAEWIKPWTWFSAARFDRLGGGI
jgi:signal peptidase I